MTALSHASATLTVGKKIEPRHRHVVAERRQPVGTEHARGDRADVPAAPGRRRVAPPALLRDRTPACASTAPAPSRASTPAHDVLPPRAAADVAAGRRHQDRSAALRPRAQHPVDVLQQRRRRPRRPARRSSCRTSSGHWPRPPVPFAAISGSSRSPCVDAGLRNTESPDIAAAVSSWLPTASELKPL